MRGISEGAGASGAGVYGGVFEAEALRKEVAEKNAEIEMLRGLITNGSSIGDTDPLVVQQAKRERWVFVPRVQRCKCESERVQGLGLGPRIQRCKCESERV